MNIKSNRYKSFAKFVRVVTVPPVMVSLLLYVLYIYRQGVFESIPEVLLSALF